MTINERIIIKTTYFHDYLIEPGIVNYFYNYYNLNKFTLIKIFYIYIFLKLTVTN